MINNIYCIGRNYTEHAKELGNIVEEDPIVFSKPNTSLIKSKFIKLPSFSNEIHFETEIVIKISKKCYQITEDRAGEYFNEVAIGLDLTARDLQSKLKDKKLPWLLSKGFSGSCYISNFVDKKNLPEKITFRMDLNSKKAQFGETDKMIFGFSRIISFISEFIELNEGDVIFTGTPHGVGKLSSGDNIKLFIEENMLAELEVL